MNISDVAKLAGVSSATVSRYFNNGYLSAEKRDRIRKVVEETGYRPSVQAQTLRTKRTMMVGVVIPKLNSSAMGSAIAGILAELGNCGYQVLLADTQNNPQKELEYMNAFSEKQVDGLILMATVYTRAHQQMINKLDIPVVVVGQRFNGQFCVYHDDYNAMREMTERVLEKGRKKLGYIGVLEQDEAVGRERYRGFCDALKKYGLDDQCANYVIAGFSIQEGYDGARVMIDRHPDLDGIICATDSIAAGTMRYLREQNIEVPDQIMVTGHGDSQIATVITPTLSTVRYMYEESGKIAARMLVQRLTGSSEDIASMEKEVCMAYEIVENESTRLKEKES